VRTGETARDIKAAHRLGGPSPRAADRQAFDKSADLELGGPDCGRDPGSADEPRPDWSTVGGEALLERIFSGPEIEFSVTRISRGANSFH
jgi:hypothetical protein